MPLDSLRSVGPPLADAFVTSARTAGGLMLVHCDDLAASRPQRAPGSVSAF